MFRDFPDDFEYILGLQESVVVAMADGYALASRKPVVVNLHSAAGVGHAMGSIFTAAKNHAPLLIIAGQQARSMLPFEPFLGSDRATELARPHVKWSAEPARAADVPAAVSQALHIAMTPPFGPTLVSVPVDDWDQPCAPVDVRTVSTRIQADEDLLLKLAEKLAGAERPALVVGPGVAQDLAWDEIINLAERHEAAVYASPLSSRNSFPEDHRLFSGFLPSNRRDLVQRLGSYDVILVVGAPAFTYHFEGSGPHAPEGASLFQITDDPLDAARTATGTSIIGSAKSALRKLAEMQPPLRSRPRLDVPRPPVKEGGALLDQDMVMRRIAASRPASSIIVWEAPSSLEPIRRNLPILIQDGFFGGASGGLGYGMPAAVGVALHRKSQRVIAIIGDGSSMYSIQALWSAAQLGVPVTFVIVNNGRYGVLIDIAHAFGIQGMVGTELPGLDFVQLAAAQGLSGTKVDRVDMLDRALQAAFAAQGPNLIEVLVSE